MYYECSKTTLTLDNWVTTLNEIAFFDKLSNIFDSTPSENIVWYSFPTQKDYLVNDVGGTK